MNKTEHKIIFGDSSKMDNVTDESIHLIITSPPYPMIEMWDEIFIKQNIEINNKFVTSNFIGAFELMHQELDKVWKECYRVLIDGGIACINIGDAARTLNENFRLFSNHSRIIDSFIKLGFQNLPNIIWRKQTNAPNKFMGSGMFPPGAYVTLEHEYILIFRKGLKREFRTDHEKNNRRKSSYFWEERNNWFSDLWDLKGTNQKLNNKESRSRSAAYPFSIPYRLINMFSIQNDIILDPFLGTGTTTLASIGSKRNSIGYEIDESFSPTIESLILSKKDFLNDIIQERINNHLIFVEKRKVEKGEDSFKHINKNYDFPVITSQELDILIPFIESIVKLDTNYQASYLTEPELVYYGSGNLFD